jgi:hypothetical protein
MRSAATDNSASAPHQTMDLLIGERDTKHCVTTAAPTSNQIVFGTFRGLDVATLLR